MPADQPIQNFHFTVNWGGTKIGFTEVSNLGMRTEVIEYRQGASPMYNPIKLPGRQRYNNIVLKRGTFAGDNEFYEWWKATTLFQEGGNRGSAFRRDITISILNDQHEPVITWKVKNAFPTELRYADLKATANEIAIESMEIAHEGISVVNG